MGIIYKATFSNVKCYIVYTKHELEKRINEHHKAAFYGRKYLFYNAIRKYGFGDIDWEVLEESEDNDYLLKERENHYITEHNSYYELYGYNMTYGGEAGSNVHWYNNLSEDAKEQYIDTLRNNLSITRNSENRAKAMKESWAMDTKRKEATASRTKKMWEDEEFRINVGKKISNIRKLDWEAGKYSREKLSIATDAAREKVAGSKWYNDGVKNYRLKPADAAITELKLIEGKVKHDKGRRNSKA